MSETKTYHPIPEGNPNSKPTKIDKQTGELPKFRGKSVKESKSKSRDGGEFLERRTRKFGMNTPKG